VTLGAQALGQLALGGASGALATYVDLTAPIAITSNVQCAISVAGQLQIAAAITVTSSVQCSLTINEPVYGAVNISASIAMVSEITSAITAMQPVPNPGVSFTLSDRAGGA
jgi:hypothetical protein